MFEKTRCKSNLSQSSTWQRLRHDLTSYLDDLRHTTRFNNAPLVRMVLASIGQQQQRGQADQGSQLLFRQLSAGEREAQQIRRRHQQLSQAHQQLRRDYQKLIGIATYCYYEFIT